MFSLVFRFPAGRYHATPWGRHVNEGAVAWPPEPYRLLRAMLAVWYRKAEVGRWNDGHLHSLIEALATTLPVYRLPDAVHAHSRHYMPQGRLDGGREKTSLVLDSFYRVDPESELVVAWPDLALGPDVFALACHLTSLFGYLGRSESLVSAFATDSIDGPFPVSADAAIGPGYEKVDVLAPLSPIEYRKIRPDLLGLNNDKARSKARSAFEATLPPALTDALQVETFQLQAVGWSRPPAGRFASYVRPEVGPRPPKFEADTRAMRDGAAVTVARLVLAGKPRPMMTDAVKIGEVFRAALMSKYGGCSPAVLSGRNEQNAPLRDPEHAHAFFLPEDHDGDGYIDHLVLFARLGISAELRRALEAIDRLWLKDGRHRNPDEDPDQGRKEWRVALDEVGEPRQFRDSALLRSSRTWVSATPYLRPLHLKRGDLWEQTRQMVTLECLRRGWPPPEVELMGDRAGREIVVGARPVNVLAFHRFRSRRRLVQPDRTGVALKLVFPTSVAGPVALGFGCHFGLGLFRAEAETGR